MWISRIRVTGGFLGGLDVSLKPGLNVIIGPRGTGKTSFLELLRHAVGGQHADQSPSAVKARIAFLKAVLKTGEVVVDIESDDGGRHLVVDAAGSGQRPDLASSVLVLGQNELEEIASDAPSRVNLLDLRTGYIGVAPDRSEVSSLTSQLSELRVQLRERSEEAEKRKRLVADRELLASQERSMIGQHSEQLAGKRDSLRKIEQRVIDSGQELERIGQLQRASETILRELDSQAVAIADVSAQARSLPDPGGLRDALLRAETNAEAARSAIQDAVASLRRGHAYASSRNIEAREEASPMRAELDAAEAGLGQLTAQLRNIDSELVALDQNDEAMNRLKSRYSDLSRERTALFEEFESAEERLFAARLQVAETTTAQIANNVIVAVDHLSNSEDYKAFLLEALRGSSVRGAVIEVISTTTLPSQLLQLIEERQVGTLSAISGIGEERAQKVLDFLDQKEILAGLARVRLSDSVDFRLIDGAVDKSVDELSTGQKCAVTLPIVLSEQNRTLILDQPEDHLDNAFLVRNIIGGLDTRRSSGAQTIVATHNANIPVLGAADNVVVLASDGKNGRVDVQNTFDSDDIVERITRLMEGGRDAFARRSAFYIQHGGPL
jgi:energy-coupling factor transporter ATP-binding protein EcfA2